MPVITPAYPSMCATFNITQSTMSVILDEIRRGLDVTLQIMENKRPWSDLFVKHTFFTKDHKYFMAVISASRLEEPYKLWTGWVESRVRLLVGKLERAPCIVRARPFVKSFERRHLCKNDEEIRKVQEGSMDYLVPPKDPNAPQAEPEAGTEVLTMTQYIGLELVEGKTRWEVLYDTC